MSTRVLIAVGAAGALAAAPAAAERRHSPAETRVLLERLLLENITPFWLGEAIDAEHGGYRLNHDADGRWLGPADKAIVTQARTVWFFARLHRSAYGKPEHLEAARHGFRFLADRMWDAEHGGFYWSVSHDGAAPVADFKHLYGQAFGLYALAEYARASSDPEAEALARRLFDLLESRAHDPEHGGYRESFPRDWNANPDAPGRGAGPSGSASFDGKLMNTHLHLMEALTTWAEVSGDDRARRRLVELILVQSNAVVRKGLGACTDRHARDWTPLLEGRDARVSYGHDVENVWLLAEACDVAGIPNGPLVDLYRALWDYTLEYGWDAERGGLYYTGPFRAPSDDRRKDWWVQAEAMTSALVLYRLTGEERYYGLFERTLDWIDEEQADWEHGDWHASIGDRPPGNKSGPWKSPYHNGRAVLECLELLEVLE